MYTDEELRQTLMVLAKKAENKCESLDEKDEKRAYYKGASDALYEALNVIEKGIKL